MSLIQYRTKYLDYIQKDTAFSETKHYSYLKLRQISWFEYRLYNYCIVNSYVAYFINVILEIERNPFAPTSRDIVLKEFFTINEIKTYSKLFIHKSKTDTQYNDVIIRRGEGWISRLLYEDEHNLFKTDPSAFILGADKTIVSNNFICDYVANINMMNSLLNKLENNPSITFERFLVIHQKLMTILNNRISPTINVNYLTEKEDNSIYTDKQEKIDYLILAKSFHNDATDYEHSRETVDKVIKERQITIKTIEIFDNNPYDTYAEKDGMNATRPIKLDNKLMIWQTTPTHIIFTYLEYFVEYYERGISVPLTLNYSRGLVIPYLILPYHTQATERVEYILKQHRSAVPMFYTIAKPLNEGLAILKNTIIHNPDSIIRHNNLLLFKYECEIKKTIASKVKTKKIDEDDLIAMFNENEVNKPKKSKKKKTSIKPISVIDVSNVAEDEIVEITTNPEETQHKSLAELTEEIIDRTDSGSDCESDTETVIKTEIENTNNNIVKYVKIPFNIIFSKYDFVSFTERDLITFMIHELFYTNEKFQRFISQYDCMRIVQGLHHDFNRKDKSLHFNAIFYDTETAIKSSQYHLYILNNEISSITTIVNVL